MSQLGILTSDQEAKLAQIIDDAINAKGVLELIDGYAAKILISQIDDRLIEKINTPEGVKDDLGMLIDAAMAGDVSLAESIAANLLNSLVDIPGLDEDAELLIFKGTIEIIVGAVLTKIRK